MSTLQKTVLIVDDESDLQEIMGGVLTPLGVQCVYASNGKDAISIIENVFPDVIVSDINMPQMSGLDVLAYLKEQGIFTPMILVTGYGDREKMRKAWHLGAYDFLDKPLKFDVLKSTVQSALDSGFQFNKERKPGVVSKKVYVPLNIQLENQLYTKVKAHCEKESVSFDMLLDKLLRQLVGG